MTDLPSQHVESSKRTLDSTDTTTSPDHGHAEKRQRSAVDEEHPLCRLKVRDIVHQKRGLAELDETATVDQALQLMHDFSITCVPIFTLHPGRWLAAGGTEILSSGKKYIGLVTLYDVVTFLVLHHKEGNVGHHRAVDLIGSSLEGQSLFSVHETDSLRRALELLCKRMHRVLVQPEDPQHPIRILSQTDVVVFLNTHASLFPVLERTTVPGHRPDLLLQPAHFVSISADMNTLEAFQRLRTEGVMAAPVLNAAGKIVGTLSSSDLRNVVWRARGSTAPGTQVVSLDNPVFACLLEHTVSSFLSALEVRPAVTLPRSATLLDAVRRVAETKVHRIWIVDAEDHVVDVVSLSDIIGTVFATTH
eukprot:gnl/Spiro4/14263_TR7671_c0_g1_i1.p1 gnl/Spiro4/14263_TR7671_c0_g1~~gnl/Spiro4/14263_TR7671_c0_g1_i1.p1  ORF type:complete len:372 (-),score=112.03 gnl/Spiro4/14263_TR7671_c0_g1_i1:4-1089(-)